MSRWVELYSTTPSGKTLFVCRMCGRTAPTPDKECRELPNTTTWKPSLPCAVLEELEEACLDMGRAEADSSQAVLPEPAPDFPVLEVYLRGHDGSVLLRYSDGSRSRRLKVELRRR